MKQQGQNTNNRLFVIIALLLIAIETMAVFLTYYKKMRPKGGMEIRNVSEPVQEVFEITGFDEFLVLR